MEFEWDENKNKKNKEKHGISFEEAKEVFKDEDRVEYQDFRRDYGEERWKVIGQIFGAIITVIYTIRKTAKRLISARRASRKERERYSQD